MQSLPILPPGMPVSGVAPGMMPGAPLSRPGNPSGIAATAPAQAPRRVVRGARPDDPPRSPRPIRIPTPEELGVARARTAEAALDWGAAHRRLQELGAVGFHLEQPTPGSFRFRCWLPRSAGGHEAIEGRGSTEAEAVRVCLESAACRQSGVR
jgi:hypothetical protein